MVYRSSNDRQKVGSSFRFLEQVPDASNRLVVVAPATVYDNLYPVWWDSAAKHRIAKPRPDCMVLNDMRPHEVVDGVTSGFRGTHDVQMIGLVVRR